MCRSLEFSLPGLAHAVGHASQLCVAFSKRPGAHGLHSVRAAFATCPAPQRVQLAVPPVLYVSSPHGTHCSVALAPVPTDRPYLPAPHEMHIVRSSWAANPVGHDLHASAVPSGA